jgi:phosphonate C-P lyase system protein PhnK
VIELDHVSKVYPLPRTRVFGERPHVTAVNDVSLTIHEGESVAIVGESGSGKTTLLRLMLALSRATRGEVRFRDREVSQCERTLRRNCGLVFQDPYSTLNPRRTIGQSIAEPLEAIGDRGNHREAVAEILTRMELPASAIDRYPREFSGGQRQRIAIARALVHQPALLVGDEPVSAVDVLVRARIIQLLRDLREEMNLTLVTVTHDLAVVPKLADRVIVMEEGQLVETGTTEQILADPQEPYTQKLMSALPRL